MSEHPKTIDEIATDYAQKLISMPEFEDINPEFIEMVFRAGANRNTSNSERTLEQVLADKKKNAAKLRDNPTSTEESRLFASGMVEAIVQIEQWIEANDSGKDSASGVRVDALVSTTQLSLKPPVGTSCEVCWNRLRDDEANIHTSLHAEDCPVWPDERWKCDECFKKSQAKCTCGIINVDVWAMAEQVVLEEVFNTKIEKNE